MSFCRNVNAPSFDVRWRVLTFQNMTGRLENLSSRGIKRHLRGYNYAKGANGVYSVLWRRHDQWPKEWVVSFARSSFVVVKAFIMENRRNNRCVHPVRDIPSSAKMGFSSVSMRGTIRSAPSQTVCFSSIICTVGTSQKVFSLERQGGKSPFKVMKTVYIQLSPNLVNESKVYL